MSAQTGSSPGLAWPEANRRFLLDELEQLRLRLKRRVLWLRRRRQDDPLQAYRGIVVSDALVDQLLAPEDRAAEEHFYREDPSAAALTRAIALIEARQRESAKAWSAGTPPALELLVQAFGLSEFERAVLFLCLAPELDPQLERLYAYVQDDATRRTPTPHLALALHGGDGAQWLAARESFLPDAPLRRFRLVTLDAGGPGAGAQGSRPLRLDDRIADYLLGGNRLDQRLEGLVSPVPAAPLDPRQSELVQRLETWLERRANDDAWPVLNLIGPAGAGKRAVARALCERAGLHLHSVELAHLPADLPERRDVRALLEREAALLRMALYLDADRAESTGEAALEWARELARNASVFVIVGSQRFWQTDGAVTAVAVPKPDRQGQRHLWHRSLEGCGARLDGKLEQLAEQFDFGPGAIARVVAAARGRAGLRNGDTEAPPSIEDLWESCRAQSARDLEDLAQRIIPCHTWEDIVLPDDVLLQLREIADQLAHRWLVYETWAFGAKLNRGRGINVLFSGSSGTGKTLAAEIIAHQLGLDLYRVDLAGVVSKYIGETEKNLKRVFDAAEQSGAILFFDEADALFGKRSEVKDSHDRYANIEINYLLQRMEEYRGLAILATNMKSLLDPAFLRRLRFVVDFPFPTAPLRRRIWQRVFPEKALVEGLDLDALARLEIAGGNIKNIALNAAFLAAAAGRPIGMEHVLHAVRREYAKLEKLLPANEPTSHHVVMHR